MTTTSTSKRRSTEHGVATTPAHVRRRRNVPLLVFGVLVVFGCALAFAVTSLNVGAGELVLAMSRDAPAGHVVTVGDLTVVRVNAPGSAHLISGADRSSVVGRPLAVPLAAHSLLTRDALGDAELPVVGRAVIGVGVKPGRYPPRLAAGAHVQAYTVPAQSVERAPQPVSDQAALPIGEATVLAVEQGQEGADAVVELQLSRDDVPQVTAAAAAGTVALVLVAPQG